ncbi:unnamed protein product [Pleuronectes platessa]|uniref:Uncharacterized protein n=1 Tax=Pleuronectes platessa TaxID=8262 RepID=A0A9N7W2L9_PLEPL|nr:unnamed protein product [Pleuronectes platessa]
MSCLKKRLCHAGSAETAVGGGRQHRGTQRGEPLLGERPLSVHSGGPEVCLQPAEISGARLLLLTVPLHPPEGGAGSKRSQGTKENYVMVSRPCPGPAAPCCWKSEQHLAPENHRQNRFEGI